MLAALLLVQTGCDTQKVDQDIDREKDLVLGKTVYSCDSHLENSTCKNLTDGQKTTVWESKTEETASDTLANWFTVDLGENYLLTGFKLVNAEAAGLDKSLNTRHFVVQVGTDGASFTTVSTVENNAEATVERNMSGFGRYVRVMIYKGTQEQGDEVARVAEFEVYGNTVKADTSIQVGNTVVRNVLAPSNPRIFDSGYDNEGYVLANYVATDEPYCLDSTGQTDCSDMLQRMLEDCGQSGGGTVYLPAGKYLLKKNITIPVHVTLRGDYRDPDTVTDGDYGTVILADTSTKSLYPGLIRLMSSSGAVGLTVYYPHQDIENVQQYPYTFEVPGVYAEPVWQSMCYSIENCTMLNSYCGISIGSGRPQNNENIGEVHSIRNVKGCVLNFGLNMENSSDTSRVQSVRFNNEYWAKAGEAFNAPERSKIDAYTRENGTGVRVTDWEFGEVYDLDIADYKVGIMAEKGNRTYPQVEFYKVKMKDCLIGFQTSSIYPLGSIMFNRLEMELLDSPEAIAFQLAAEIDHEYPGTFQLTNGVIDAKSGRIMTCRQDQYVNIQNTTFVSWGSEYAIEATAGRLIMNGCRFQKPLTEQAKAVRINDLTWFASLAGNQYEGAAEHFLVNQGCTNVDYSEEAAATEPITKEYKERETVSKPATDKLFVVTDKKYKANTSGAVDATEAIQKALDDAGKAGGGTVYLPVGAYRLDGNLTVPKGVELRGVDDVHHRAESKGSTFWVTGGKGTENPDSAPAAITLSEGAGIRGVNFYYAEMPNKNNASYTPYPYAVRGNGADVYVINVSFVNGWNGVDFSGEHSEFHCDNHYVRSLDGLFLSHGISVGNSKIGWIEQMNCNPTYWCRPDFPSKMSEKVVQERLCQYMEDNGTVIVSLGNCEEEYLLNIGMYAGSTGYHFYEQDGKGPNALLIHCPADGMGEVYLVDATGDQGVDIANSVLCVLKGNASRDGIHVNSGTVRAESFVGLNIQTAAVRVTGGNLTLTNAAFVDQYYR